MKIFLLGFLFICLIGCKPKPVTPPVTPNETARILINPTFGQNSLFLDSIYQGPNGIRIKITDINFYTTLLSCQNNLFAEVGYFDFRDKGNLLVEQTLDYANFPSLSLVLGVDTSLNHDDPSAFPNDSPLNIMNAGVMHWGWNTGYIFISVEGKADTLVDGVDNFNVSFSYHIGTDTYLQALNFNNVPWEKTNDHQHTLALKLDMEQFFFNQQQPIDIANEPFTHSGAGFATLTQKVAVNFKNALTLP